VTRENEFQGMYLAFAGAVGQERPCSASSVRQRKWIKVMFSTVAVETKIIRHDFLKFGDAKKCRMANPGQYQ
jgi:hypothetical protein